MLCEIILSTFVSIASWLYDEDLTGPSTSTTGCAADQITSSIFPGVGAEVSVSQKSDNAPQNFADKVTTSCQRPPCKRASPTSSHTPSALNPLRLGP